MLLSGSRGVGGILTSASTTGAELILYDLEEDEEASDDEIREAVRVGRMVRKGAAKTWDDEIGKILA